MKYLGIDWGLRRIGLAISEGNLASPFQTIEVQNLQQALNKISGIVDQEQIDLLIIGQPEGEMGKVVTKVINKLQKLGLKVEASDETLSSQRARQLMIDQNIAQKRREDDDSYSAMLILQNYLDEKN